MELKQSLGLQPLNCLLTGKYFDNGPALPVSSLRLVVLVVTINCLPSVVQLSVKLDVSFSD